MAQAIAFLFNRIFYDKKAIFQIRKYGFLLFIESEEGCLFICL